ncbi:MAG: phosphoenolpyruvate synthase [Cytophagaceae bacterium]|nr:phosphoenolpyruvate synthase [Cytophagaceae bacterium]
MNRKLWTNVFLALYLLVPITIGAQESLTSKAIEHLVEQYKKDRRGPYSGIKWFCDDGTQRAPRDPCPEETGGGIQHASFRQDAIDLRTSNHLFFGEILAGLAPSEFLDRQNHYSRLKQYQLNKYLAKVDDGWVLRRAQYYRGAFQSEDEQAWGNDFFEAVLNDDNFLKEQYYLIGQALKDIPHSGDTNLAQKMRVESKLLAEAHPSFMDIRIKIHGQPQQSDIDLVKAYLSQNKASLASASLQDFEELINTMQRYYAAVDVDRLYDETTQISEQQQLTKEIIVFLESYRQTKDSKQLVVALSHLLYRIRQDIPQFQQASNRLALLDLSNEFETILLREVQNWQPDTLDGLLQKIHALLCAAAGTGLLEIWEYQAIQDQLSAFQLQDTLTIAQLNELLNMARSSVEWSTAMVKSNYEETVQTYAQFEPLAYGFIDDSVRSSVALPLGETVARLGQFVARVSQMENKVMGIPAQSSIRGLNPGYAYGKLIVVEGNPDAVDVSTENIYIFERPPSDLKPVAGIMTVSEGNLVSHVQLLARNLGIPNAALSQKNLLALKKYHQQMVFYAVSPKGNVILKQENDMTPQEQLLFDQKERSQDVIEVPTHDIKLNVQKVVNMREVAASDSGKLCGPKAANLGALKQLFPEHVVEGLIVPFGVFRAHMEQPMPGQNTSYWGFLNNTFAKAETMKSQQAAAQSIVSFQLEQLETLHKAILKIELDPGFVEDLRQQFETAFDKEIGSIPVFLRSDTNMEDLKEFTGAGLNLTLFNIRDEKTILQGIKRVWASAYTERSFKWRQQYLSNPENVFPSILIIPSVDVDYSGVMITKGINAGGEDDLTVAFSRGAGGAVDGQSAETRLITATSTRLLAPARQPDYIRLPASGGTRHYYTSFDSPILNAQNISDIREIAKKVRAKMTSDTANSHQAFDVEFGFKDDELWLFQIRPFVENKNAKSSEYLSTITPSIAGQTTIAIQTSLE